MSEHLEKEMKRLRKNILPQMPSNVFKDMPGSVKILHINIGNLKRKMEDIKDDDIVQNLHIISVNETHLGHSDILTPDIMGISKIFAVKISEPIQIIVVSVCRPPSTPIDVFMNHMLAIIAQFHHIPTCIV